MVQHPTPAAPAALAVSGEVLTPRSFSLAELALLPGQVPDLEARIPGRAGRAVELRAILAAVGVGPRATHVTVSASDGAFHASVPLSAIGEAVIAYALGDSPLPEALGGPLRFFIPDASRCDVASGVNECANVKRLAALRLTAGPGEDTRPTTSRRPVTGPGEALP
jgi:DMSO/TMAO reductase YedYZ molybdopterin-dependent catalytic subunit